VKTEVGERNPSGSLPWRPPRHAVPQAKEGSQLNSKDWVMKNGEFVLRAAPSFLMKENAELGPTIQAESGGPLVLKFGVSRSFVQVVGWMLLSMMIAGPDVPRGYSQNSRLARSDTTIAKASLYGSEATPHSESKHFSSPRKAIQPDIVLPDIYILVPARISEPEKISSHGNADEPAAKGYSLVDTITLEQQLQKAENELRALRNERIRLWKRMEQFKIHSVNGANGSVRKRPELL